MSVYNDDFYKARHSSTAYAADRILTLLLEILPPVTSAVDLGCGVGTWLRVLKEKGIEQIQGVEGDWLDTELLQIPEECFTAHDLQQPLTLDTTFDLAISLEVAEHLKAEKATQFVESLTALSDYVLFSAAIPGQGGESHVNEQWPDYWAHLFRERGFTPVDVIRSPIWNDDQIPIWYRQNILLFVRNEKLESLGISGEAVSIPLSIVHPELYLDKTRLPFRLEKLVNKLYLPLKRAVSKKKAAK